MSAADLLLTVRGQDDRWLSMTPDRTYFEAKYQPRVNRSRETYEIPFDNQDATFGSTGRCTIPVKGDYMTRMTLRTVMPPIYQTVPGQYVFPTPSSQVGANVYVNMGLTQVDADGVTLTANTTGNHYFTVGAPVILTETGTLDGTFSIASIPTANSFTCSSSLIGTSTQGNASSVGIVCADNISYFSTQNSNLWINNLTNKTWKIINASLVGNQLTLTTSTPSKFAVGSQVVVNMSTIGILQQPVTVTSSTDTTFSYTYDNTFAMVSLDNKQAYSINGGNSWTSVTSPLSGQWNGIGFGHGTFVAVGFGAQAYSSDGKTWTSVSSPLFGNWRSVAWSPTGDANGTFAIVSDGPNYQAYSKDSGRTWTLSSTQIPGPWKSVTFGNGVFVAVGTTQIYGTNGNLWFTIPFPYYGVWNSVAYGNNTAIAVGPGNSIITSSTPTFQWNLVMSPPLYGGTWNSIAFGNGTFVIVGSAPVAYSTDDGASWTNSFAPPPVNCTSVTFGNGVFVAIAPNFQMYSSTNGISWISSSPTISGAWSGVAYNTFFYYWSGSGSPDSVSLVTPPIEVNDRSFTSTVYPSISFATADDAAFWGFDSREGFTYSLPATPPWTYTQSGWIAGFLPPATSTYDDSVAHKLCKAVRILVGKQTIKEYSGEYIELQNDLLVPYENKAILKLMNGTLDQTQAVVSREYYVNLPIGTKEVPLCALTNQHMSIEIDFEQYQNLSQNLNPGTGAFTDAMSYVTYANQALNARSTLSYQQYIFIVTYDERLIVFDTTQDISSSFIFSVSGSRQLCIQSGYLYIGLLNGLGRVILSELVQGNVSSYTVSTVGLNQNNNGPMISDFRYVYIICDDPGAPLIVQYDTTSDFNDFYGSYVLGNYYVKQLILTGSNIIMIPNGQPGKLYTYKLNADFSVQWYPIDYSTYGYEITEGVFIGNSVYFICDGNKILSYSNSTFIVLAQNPNLTGTKNLMSMGDYIYASADQGVVRINVSNASIEYPAPVPFDGSAPRIFAHGPRYVYMFTQDSMSPTSVVRYDPYAQISSFQASILVDYESLPPEVPKPDKALLGLVQTQKVTDMKYMNIKGPVKELWVTGASATTNVFQYSNLATRSTLELTGEKIVTDDDGTHAFLNVIEPFETHTSMPIRNVSVISFEFDPESEIPNGTINFSRIRDQVLSANAQTVWARTYNLLTIQDGIGGLIFNS